MKKAFLLLAVGGLLFANVNIARADEEDDEPGRVTCYSTFSGDDGETTIVKCLHCTEQENVVTYSDSGKCRP